MLKNENASGQAGSKDFIIQESNCDSIQQGVKNQSLQVTLITSEKPKTLTKTFQLDEQGKLKKTTVATLVEGVAETITLEKPADLADLLQRLEKNQALCYGVTGYEKIKLTTKKRFEEKGQPAGYVTRTNDFFRFNGLGILLVDYDPIEGQSPLSREELFNWLNKAAPALANAASVSCVSASSLISNSATGEQLTDVRGQRIYLLVMDASDIPRAGKVLFDRLWLDGSGCYEVSRAGSLLERSILDATVWQPNRLDFAAGAHCIKPLVQKRQGVHLIC